MSAITILFNRNGSGVDQKLFREMFSALDIQGVDGKRTEIIEDIAFGHQHFWCVPEEVNEEQPLRINENLFVLMDGRFDNRDELLNRLEINCVNDISDAKIAGLLFEKYGKYFFEKPLGSYVLVFIELKEKRVTAVRDHLGDKTLYYHLSPNLFVLASEEKSLIKHKDISKEIDDSRMAVHFGYVERRDDSTYFRDIKEIYPAKYIQVTAKNFEYKSYWNLTNQQKIRYKNESDYLDHFRLIFVDSIQKRTRSIFNPTVLLSGGIDSSSIVAVLSKMLNGDNENLKTASYYFNKFESSNELEYINSVNEKFKIDGIKFKGDKFLPFSSFNELNLSLNKPLITPFFDIFKEVFSSLNKQNRKMVLNGWAADNLFVGANEWLMDITKEFKFIRLINEIFTHTSQIGVRSLHKDPSFRFLFSSLKPIRNIMFPKKEQKLKPWLNKYSDLKIKKQFAWVHDMEKHHRESQIKAICGLNQSMECSSHFYVFAGEPMDLRYPFRDRKLVEFFLNIPAYMLHSKNCSKNKYILTESLKGDLPEKIYKRKDFGNYGKLISYGFESNRKNVLGYLENRQLFKTFIDTKWFNEILANKSISPMNALIIWQILTFEIWMDCLYNS